MTKETTAEEDALPEYAAELAAFHRAFRPELTAIVRSLPLHPEMQVVDIGCGDGFYLELFAERLRAPGKVTGLDPCEAYLDLAKQSAALQAAKCGVDYRQGKLDSLAGRHEFDLVWCAQSLYSLPEPTQALRQMASAAKPGGLVAVLENDTLHQVLLPWPGELELAIRAAELEDFRDETSRPQKYYIGRRLPSAFAEAGLQPLHFRTQTIDRVAPLDADLEKFLQAYLSRLADRVAHRLPPKFARDFAALIDPAGAEYLLRRPHFVLSWLNVMVWGRCDSSCA